MIHRRSCAPVVRRRRRRPVREGCSCLQSNVSFERSGLAGCQSWAWRSRSWSPPRTSRLRRAGDHPSRPRSSTAFGLRRACGVRAIAASSTRSTEPPPYVSLRAVASSSSARSPVSATWWSASPTDGATRTANSVPTSVDTGDIVLAGGTIGRATDRFFFGLRIGDDYADPSPYIGAMRTRPRLVPIDATPPRPPPPARPTCRRPATSPER